MAIKTARCEKPGQPRIDSDKCTVCGLCVKLCPTSTLELRDGHVAVEPDTVFGCFGCGHCMAVCPSGAVTVSGRGISPRDVMELPPLSDCATVGQLASLMRLRRSVRHFADREVEMEKVERILEMASTAPMGIPPTDVEVLVFAGRRKVQEFALDINHLMQKALSYFTPARLILMRPLLGRTNVELFKGFILPLCREVVRQRELGHDELFYNAPLAMLFHGSVYSDPLDAGIAATYAMLGAESLGLGSCMIGSVCPFLSRDKSLRSKYGIKRGNKLSIVVVFGYPQYKFSRAIKRDFSEVRYHGH